MATLIDPRIGTVHLDANAIDLDGERDALVSRLLDLNDAAKIGINLAGSVRRQIAHPNTPMHVRAALLPQIYTLDVIRTSEETARLDSIVALVRGNSPSNQHDADAEHVFEAWKYGARYFITEDRGLLKKRGEISRLLGATPVIVTLQEFIAKYDEFAAAYSV